MEQEWSYREQDDGFWLFWGENRTARFDEHVVTEEMERIVEKLNEGTPFDVVS